MKTTFVKLLMVIFSSSMLTAPLLAKPYKVDGVNVPSGRILAVLGRSRQ